MAIYCSTQGLKLMRFFFTVLCMFPRGVKSCSLADDRIMLFVTEDERPFVETLDKVGSCPIEPLEMTFSGASLPNDLCDRKCAM
jgi:hypothetical protein